MTTHTQFTSDIDWSDRLEAYFWSVYPPLVRDMFDYKNDKFYMAINLQYACADTLTIDKINWYSNGEGRQVEPIMNNGFIEFFDVKERTRRGATDIIGIVQDHAENNLIKEYIKHVEAKMGRKVIGATFSYCDSGYYMKKHKDRSEKYDNRYHHVLKNGDVASLAWFNDDMTEIDAVYGQRGDTFFFNGRDFYHHFPRTKSERIHLILNIE